MANRTTGDQKEDGWMEILVLKERLNNFTKNKMKKILQKSATGTFV